MDDKIIVTNRKALTAKYGAAGLASIRKALSALVAADKARSLKTRIVYLDDKAGMTKLGGKEVQNAKDPRANKRAIDAVFKAIKPDYLMILGAPDVVPHQDLDNPAFGIDEVDDDRHAWGDVPYACDAPYSKDPAAFLGPTRVVGRLPDLMNAKEPSHILALLNTASKYKSRPSAAYRGYFGLTADAWKGSTRMSLENIFGNADSLVLAPPSGPAYPGGELRPRAHFINCHGGTASPEFLGQKGEKYPASLTTQTTAGEIAEGTVAAVECCYGAELYDAETLAIDPPICQSYLRQGAYGYLGSTTIAYGPVDENGAADLICQYFLINVLAGASIGRAALLARQQFVEQTAQMDPFDLKTLAQFCLLGDPSVHPVGAVAEGNTQKGKAARDVDRFSRSERREKMALTGAFLKASKPTASKRAPSDKLSSASRQALANIAKLAGLKATQVFTAFAVNRPGGAKSGTAKAGSVPTRYLLTLGKGSNAAANDNVKVNRGVAVIAKVLNGRIVGSRIYHQR